jgi:hypothetical protein
VMCWWGKAPWPCMCTAGRAYITAQVGPHMARGLGCWMMLGDHCSNEHTAHQGFTMGSQRL